ncbi:MAG: amidohydrolase [Clostridia bacterium]
MVENELKRIIDLRHKLHQYPELSNQESITKKILMEFLKDNTNLEIIDKGKWFYAKYFTDKKNKNIAFRADFDAIMMEEFLDLSYGSKNNGVAHKCGHDGHVAILSALALELERLRPDRNVYLIFQHAEETGNGAFECLEFIDECEIDEIFAFHNTSGIPFGSVMIKNGVMNYASKGMIIELVGTPTHASRPENGANPSYAFAKIIEELENISKDDKFKGLILATIIKVDIGQEAFGIAAHSGRLMVTIRAEIEDELNYLQEYLEDFVNRVAKEEKLKCTFSYKDQFPATVNHLESVNKVINVSKKLDIDVIEMEEGMRGSEDFGHFLNETRGAIFYVGNGKNYPPLHTKEYDFNDKLIPIVLEIFKSLIMIN